jgi:hypothetical protein
MYHQLQDSNGNSHGPLLLLFGDGDANRIGGATLPDGDGEADCRDSLAEGDAVADGLGEIDGDGVGPGVRVPVGVGVGVGVARGAGGVTRIASRALPSGLTTPPRPVTPISTDAG